MGDERTHDVKMGKAGTRPWLYNATCSCGYRMFNTTRGLIERHREGHEIDDQRRQLSGGSEKG